MLTENRTYGTPSRVGRKKQFEARITLPLEAEQLARVDAALEDGEARLDMIRQAIDRELKRRARTPQRPTRKAKPQDQQSPHRRLRNSPRPA